MMLTENARHILETRYLTKDANGAPTETAEHLFQRVAATVAAVDTFYGDYDPQETQDHFYAMMTQLEFLPNSPTLMNAGRPLGQLSACFVLPVDDSMEDIFEAVKQAALIHQSGGGTGFSFSRLRPRGSAVHSTGGIASGPVSFMNVFNTATEAVKQGGTRRGANMGVLRVDHPDILDFIHCKEDPWALTNFNISVGITDAFMQAVVNDGSFDLIDPRTGAVSATLQAGDIFHQIAAAAWHNGEPGILFLDRLNRDNVLPSLGEIAATNPCGEQPLFPYESCNLGSINLVKMLKSNQQGTFVIDWDKLGTTVDHAVHFLDNVIDANRWPLPVIAETTRQTRKIGLGVMAFADMLLMMNLSYASEEAIRLAEDIMSFIQTKAQETSGKLAQSRGSFPLFKESTLSPEREQRNATLTTIAPTGTLSIIAGVSSGIEPVFAYAYRRQVMDGTLWETHPFLHKELAKRGLLSDTLLQRLASGGSPASMEDLPPDLRRVFVSAHDISPEAHVRMQAAFQKHTDNAVSKTVNFPGGASPEDVRQTYLLAFETGCKGVTVYRDGSRVGQVLSAGSATETGNRSM